MYYSVGPCIKGSRREAALRDPILRTCMTITDTPGALLAAVLPVVRRFRADPHTAYGIALGGSHAKGTSDALSDVDVYLFAPAVLPGTQRIEVVAEAFGLAPEAVSSWGGDEPFEQGGTDFRFRNREVECWLRNTESIASVIDSAKRGEIRREYSVWAVAGFFDYVALSDIQAMHVVEDPFGLLSGWKAEVARYPESLRRAVLDRFTREAAFWPDNFHYRTAVERVDALYTSGIVQQVVHALIQSVFAVNGVYFPGDKKLGSALDALPVRPEAFAQRVQALLFPGAEPDRGLLEEQRRALGVLVADVESLVAAQCA